MARLEAVLAKGYYPLHARVARQIGRKLNCDEGATIFDPCAGKGSAVMNIAHHCGIPFDHVYASELDVGRAEELRENLSEGTVFGPVDFLGASAFGDASVTYVNPPFDDELGGGGRVEDRFIERAVDCTMVGGLVVIVLPERTADRWQTIKLMRSVLSDLVAFMPVEECRPFKEVVIFGRKLAKKVVPYNHLTLRDITKDISDIEVMHVAKGKSVRVRKVQYTAQELEPILAKSSASELISPVRKIKRKVARPPMPLRKGHRAMLLASGYMDGVIDIGDGNPHVVRGTAIKVVDKVEKVEDGKITVVETDRICLVVKTVTQDGKITSLSDNIEEVEEGESND